jgi:hypothetical protein
VKYFSCSKAWIFFGSLKKFKFCQLIFWLFQFVYLNVAVALVRVYYYCIKKKNLNKQAHNTFLMSAEGGRPNTAVARSS